MGTRGRTVRRRFAGLLVVLATLVSAPLAVADCGHDIIDDWRDDNVVDRTYPTACYRLAFPRIPQDAEEYSTIVADLQRALARDTRRERDGVRPDVPPPPADALPPSDAGTGGRAATPGDDRPAEDATTPAATPAAETADEAGDADDAGDDDGSAAAPVEDPGGTDGTGLFGELIGVGGSGSADEVPVAVIVLASAAGLLVAVGAAGLVAQRRQGRN